MSARQASRWRVAATLAAGIWLTVGAASVAWGADPEAPRGWHAPDATPEAKPEEAGIHIAFDAETPVEEGEQEGSFPYAPPIEQIFQNPAVVSGLASGTDALNRSVESLMDSLFYSLLDNETNHSFNSAVSFNVGLKRDLYTTPNGSNVVVDRMQLGPRYAKELWRFQNIPITLGIDGTVDVLQIYLRTDGMRVMEQEELSPWRRRANNWFGLVPALAAVLPPSFNQNEMYDPIRELETPFVFPTSVEGFYKMPVGSIRSYSVSGGVRMAADLGALLDDASQEVLERVGDVQQSLPYSIFRRGEHRINVLRRDQDTAWVGVANLDRTGHAISPLLGHRYNVLKGALGASLFGMKWVWKGVPALFFPISLDFERAFAKLFDQVYQYDLREKVAREAYLAAVRGDFEPSEDAIHAPQHGGVTFDFRRHQGRHEDQSENGPNIAIFRKVRRVDHGAAEVEIVDPDGKFYVLESSTDVSDKTWDILVGEEEHRQTSTLELKVRKLPERVVPPDADDDGPSGAQYELEAVDDPYRLSIAYSIQDRYVVTTEYDRYLDELRQFTSLPLNDLPFLPRRDPEDEKRWRRESYALEPAAASTRVHVTPTYLGRFGAQAALSFSTVELDRIAQAPEQDAWDAFARAFGVSPLAWSSAERRDNAAARFDWLKAFAFYPLRLVNMRFASVDAINEATLGVRRLRALALAKSPSEKLAAFHELLDTDHPRELARALLNLAKLGDVPRRVTFSAQPKGDARHEIKAAYGRLNNMTIKAGPPFPPPSRYARAKEKLAKFYLDRPQEATDRPLVNRVDVTAQPVPQALRVLSDEPLDGGLGEPSETLEHEARHVQVELLVRGVPQGKPIKAYVRVEQAGKLKIGKLALAEQVVTLAPVGERDNAQRYRFFLTGPLSPIKTFMMAQAMGTGDEFRVTMSISFNGDTWSDERSLEFRFAEGMLTPIK